MDGGNDSKVDAAEVGAQEASCVPAQVSGWTPVPVLPAAFFEECTEAQIQAVVDACFRGKGVNAACNAFTQDPANKSCVGCIFLDYSSTPIRPGHNPVPPAAIGWGAEIQVADTNEGITSIPNIGGCVALADPSQTLCGEEYSTLIQCEVEACGANCPLPSSKLSAKENAIASANLSECMQLAGANGCNYYASQPAHDCASAMTGPASFCFAINQSTDPNVLAAAWVKFLRLQCGMYAVTGLPDAGARD